MRPTRGTVALAALAGSVIFVGACALPNVGLLDASQVGDTRLYHTYGSRLIDGELPYRDFSLEYPPGALAAFALPALGGPGSYALRFKLIGCLLGALTVTLVAVSLAALGAGRLAVMSGTALVGLAPAALGPVFLVNFDLWPAVLTTGALAALLLGRDKLGLVALAAAAAVKVYPLVLLPVAFLHVRRRSGARAAWRATGAFALVLAVVGLPFVLLAPRGVGFALANVFRRPLQIESLGSGVLLAAHRLGLYEPQVTSSFGSQNLDGSLPWAVAAVTAAVLVASLLAVWGWFARRPTRDSLPLAAAAAVTAFLAFGKVLSPQYLVWLVPLVAVAALRASLAAWALLGAALALTQLWFPARYGDLVALEAVSWLVVVRGLVLVALFGFLAARLRSCTSVKPVR